NSPTYYDLLKIKASASADEIRNAFHRLAREAHPDNFVTASADELQKMAENYRKVTEAYRVLRDPNTRRAYDDTFKSGAGTGSVSTHGQSLSTGLRRSSIARLAIPYYTQAQQAIKAGNWKQALLHLQLASRHDPKNEDIAKLMQTAQEKVKTRK